MLWSLLCCHGNELLVYISRAGWGHPWFACLPKELPSSLAVPPSAPNLTQADLVWLMRWQRELPHLRLCDKSWSAQRSSETKAGGARIRSWEEGTPCPDPPRAVPGASHGPGGKPIRLSQWERLCRHLWDQGVTGGGCLMACRGRAFGVLVVCLKSNIRWKHSSGTNP